MKSNPSKIVSTLNTFANKEDAEVFLTTFGKKELTDALKEMDVPVTKQDNIERLKEKLLEHTIVYKIRSQTIRGNCKIGNW